MSRQAKNKGVDFIVVMELEDDASVLELIATVEEHSLSYGKKITASSNNQNYSVEGLAGGGEEIFDQGIYLRAGWRPEGGDPQPWVEIDLEQATLISQIVLQEGKRAFCEKFSLQYRDASGSYITLCQGDKLEDFSIKFREIETDRIRLNILDGSANLETFEIY
jgi:hypothetical protein